MKAIKCGDMNATLPQLQTSRQIFHGLSVPSSPTSAMPEDTTVQQRRTSRDWDEIMRDLIHGLEQICGPKKGQDRRSLQLDFTLSPAVSGPPSPRIFNQELLRTERGIHDNGGGHGSVNYRRHSDEPSLRNRGQRTLFVRHIETHENLNSKLFEICRQGSLTEVVRSRTSGERWGAVRLAMTSALASKTYQGLEEEEKNSQRLVRMNQRRVRFDMGDEEDDTYLIQVNKDQSDIRLYAKDDQRDARLQFEGDPQHREEGDQRNTEFRAEEDQTDKCLNPMEDQLESHPIQVEVGSRAIEDLVVSVSDRRHLTVEAISTFGDSILHDSLLSDDLTSGSLLCHLTGNGQLYIRRQSPLLATENFVGTGSTFIPIIRRNEASLELTVVLHIPEDFRFDDVVVRTVDSQLVVIGRKRSSSLQPIDGDMRLNSHDAVRPSFRVFVQLPREVNCRSVNASLTEDHQLIVKGDIDPTPRRNSL